MAYISKPLVKKFRTL